MKLTGHCIVFNFRCPGWRRRRFERVSRVARRPERRLPGARWPDDPGQAVHARFGPSGRVLWHLGGGVNSKSTLWLGRNHMWPLFDPLLDVFGATLIGKAVVKMHIQKFSSFSCSQSIMSTRCSKLSRFFFQNIFKFFSFFLNILYFKKYL